MRRASVLFSVGNPNGLGEWVEIVGGVVNVDGDNQPAVSGFTYLELFVDPAA